jgi:hypothetical protein
VSTRHRSIESQCQRWPPDAGISSGRVWRALVGQPCGHAADCRKSRLRAVPCCCCAPRYGTLGA